MLKHKFVALCSKSLHAVSYDWHLHAHTALGFDHRVSIGILHILQKSREIFQPEYLAILWLHGWADWPDSLGLEKCALKLFRQSISSLYCLVGHGWHDSKTTWNPWEFQDPALIQISGLDMIPCIFDAPGNTWNLSYHCWVIQRIRFWVRKTTLRQGAADEISSTIPWAAQALPSPAEGWVQHGMQVGHVQAFPQKVSDKIINSVVKNSQYVWAAWQRAQGQKERDRGRERERESERDHLSRIIIAGFANFIALFVLFKQGMLNMIQHV